MPTLFVKSGSTASFGAYQGGNTAVVNLYLNVIGSGRVTFKTNGMNSRIREHCNFANFTGDVTATTSGTDHLQGVQIFKAGDATIIDCSKSRWYITSETYQQRQESTRDLEFETFREDDITYKFGVIQTYVSNSYGKNNAKANKGVVLEVGEKIDEISWLRNSWVQQDPTYGGKVKWLAKTATFTQAAANAYEVDIMGGGKVYVEASDTENAEAEFVPSVIKFLQYTDSESVTRVGGYLTIDDSNSDIAGNIADAIAAAGSGETAAPVGFNVTASSDVSASVTAGKPILSLGAGIKKTGTGALTLTGAFTALGEVSVSGGALTIETESELSYSLAAGTYVSVSGNAYTFSNTYNSDSDCTIADEENLGGSVTISSTWINGTDIATAATENETTVPELLSPTSTVTAANGYNYFTCYALDLSTTEATDKPIVSVVANSDGTFSMSIKHADGTDISEASNVTAEPTFYSYDPSTGTYGETGLGATVTPAAVVGDNDVGYIRAKIAISAK